MSNELRKTHSHLHEKFFSFLDLIITCFNTISGKLNRFSGLPNVDILMNSFYFFPYNFLYLFCWLKYTYYKNTEINIFPILIFAICTNCENEKSFFPIIRRLKKRGQIVSLKCWIWIRTKISFIFQILCNTFAL